MNVGSTANIQINTLVRGIHDQLAFEQDLEFAEWNGADPDNTHADTSTREELLDYQPDHTSRRGSRC